MMVGFQNQSHLQAHQANYALLPDVMRLHVVSQSDHALRYEAHQVSRNQVS